MQTMTTIDKQSQILSPLTVTMTAKSRSSTSSPPPAPPTPFSSPAADGTIAISDVGDSMCVDNEIAMNVTKLLSDQVASDKPNDRACGNNNSNSSVNFSKVEIIELPYTLGDNPAVSSGPPVSASWIAQKRTILDLEFFERYRPKRRNRKALQLTKDARKSLYVQTSLPPKNMTFGFICCE